MPDRLYAAVKALIERDGNILVLKTETADSIYWVLPGGKIEYGEAPLETLKRELREEISCGAEISEPIGMYHFFTGKNDNGDQVVLTVFKADIGDQEIDISDNPIDEGITEYRWLKPSELIERSDNESLQELIAEQFDLSKK